MFRLTDGGGGGGGGSGVVWLNNGNWYRVTGNLKSICHLAEYLAGKTQNGPNTYDRLFTTMMSLFANVSHCVTLPGSVGETDTY